MAARGSYAPVGFGCPGGAVDPSKEGGAGAPADPAVIKPVGGGPALGSLLTAFSYSELVSVTTKQNM